MSDTPSAYPLQWPLGVPRTPAHKRMKAPFATQGRDQLGQKTKPREVTVAEALKRLQQQLDLLGAKYAVLSSNIEIRLDGLPYSNRRDPNDPGVCAYFQLKGKSTALPSDRFERAADNIAAIAAHIDATRRIERYGVATTEQMFAGFQAIRGPGNKPWRETFGLRPNDAVTAEMVRARHLERARQIHPDVAGSIPGADAAMAELNAARDDALKELSHE